MYYIPCKSNARKQLVKRLNDKGFTHKDHHRMVLYVLSSQKTGMCVEMKDSERNGYVAVDFKTIEENFSKCSGKVLDFVDRGILDIVEYTRPTNDEETGRCRHFKLNQSLIDEFDELNSYKNKSDKIIMSENGVNTYCPTHKFYDENRNYYPDIIVQSMSKIKSCPLNYSQLAECEKQYSKKDSDYFHLNYLLSMMEVDGDQEFGYYKPAYHVVNTGRIFERYGIQPISKRIKVEAFRGIDVVNYDLKSSQANGLIDQFEKANINCEWLNNYVNDASFREEQYKGIGKALYKKMIYSVFFGGKVPVSAKQAYAGNMECSSDILKMVDSSSDLDSILNNFHESTKELRGSISKWHNYLINDYVKDSKNYPGRNKQLIMNDLRMRLNIKGMKTDEVKRKLSAHILQGAESKFIHTLTAISDDYGFSVYVNAHDGLVTNKEIPQSAIDRAKKICNMPNCELIIKPISE